MAHELDSQSVDDIGRILTWSKNLYTTITPYNSIMRTVEKNAKLRGVVSDQIKTIDSLQSQLAAANERAEALQRTINEALSQSPAATIVEIDDGLGTTFLEFNEPRGPAGTNYYAAPVPAQPAVVPEGLANAVLANIAAIAHCGGLAKLDNENALSNIRQLSKPWCDNTGTLRDLKNRVDAAILSTTDTEVKK